MTLGHAMGAGARGRRLREGGRVTPKKAKPKVCLVMIVRDEEAIIRERLLDVLPDIDGWCITDTGSTDGTVDVLLQTMRSAEIPGSLHTTEWRGFAAARTEAVDEAESFARAQGGEWWALLLDADTVWRRIRSWRSCIDPGMQPGVDHVRCDVYHDSLRYSHPRLLKLGAHEWRWRGVLHEYLEVPAGARGIDTSVIYVEHGHGGAREADPDKYRKDAELLASTREALALHPDGDDADLLPRYAFYEAQSWRDAGEHQRAIDCYTERTTMGGWFEEVYQSWLQIGALRWAHQSRDGALQAFLMAYSADPTRAEALIALATMAREREAWPAAMLFAEWAQARVSTYGAHGLFADVNVRWRALFEISVAAWYTGDRTRGAGAAEALLAEGEHVPAAVLERTKANLALYMEGR